MEKVDIQLVNICEQISSEYSVIQKIVKYLNRDIQIHELNIDKIRNRADSYSYIREWNNDIDDIIQKYRSNSFIQSRRLDLFKVQFDSE